MDIHSNQTIYLERPELVVPPRKTAKGRAPTLVGATTQGVSARDYKDSIHPHEWHDISVRNTTKGRLRADYHFKQVFIWDKDKGFILPRLLVIRRTYGKNGEAEYKFSFTNAHLEQYTEEGIAYMQAQRFFVEHRIKESKQILGLDQFQTRKWTAWQHQVTLNLLVSSFILKEKLSSFKNIPLITAKDIKDLNYTSK